MTIKGDSIPTLVQTILDNAKNKRDYIIPATTLRMTEDQELTWMNAAGPVVTEPSDHARNQLADYLGIPRGFMQKLRENAPDLISVNVNRLLDNHQNEKRLVRTLNGHTRAILSNRFGLYENEEVAEYLFPVILDQPQFQIESATVTDKALYVQVVTPALTGEIRVGDVIQGGFIIKNSEIGLGKIEIDPFLKRLRCTNGMMGFDYGKKRAHLGGSLLGNDDSFTVLKDETIQAKNQAFWLEMRDHLNTLTSEEGFKKILQDIREKANDAVPGDPGLVVEEVASRFQLREAEKKSVLYSYLGERDHTRWGLANAMTQVANAHPSYDRAIELQGMGGDIMALQGSEWTSLVSRGQ
jgi:hypothetical protein